MRRAVTFFVWLVVLSAIGFSWVIPMYIGSAQDLQEAEKKAEKQHKARIKAKVLAKIEPDIKLEAGLTPCIDQEVDSWFYSTETFLLCAELELRSP